MTPAPKARIVVLERLQCAPRDDLAEAAAVKNLGRTWCTHIPTQKR